MTPLGAKRFSNDSVDSAPGDGILSKEKIAAESETIRALRERIACCF